METEQKQNVEIKEERVECAAEERQSGGFEFFQQISKFLNLATLNAVLFLGFIFLCAGYLTVSNQLISRGFSINELKTSLQETEKQNRGLELEVMGLESYAEIDKRVTAMKMVKVGEVEYIEAKKESVAMR